MTRMRIVVMGSGGTGGYFGAKLARAGEDVTFVARGAHRAAIEAELARIDPVWDRRLASGDRGIAQLLRRCQPVVGHAILLPFAEAYSVVADLREGTRYDRVVEALGGHGWLVREPAELRPALERALAADGPALVNVLTDPAVAYPRSANLA